MKTKVWAHRGASGYAPENIPGGHLKLAVKQQADGVELDVQLTKTENWWFFMMKPWTGQRMERDL